MIYDLIIIGGGPGGCAAGLYAGRKKLNTLFITDSFGGQSIVAEKIENWLGVKEISGFELAKALEEHLKTQKSIEIKEGELAIDVSKKNGNFLIKTNKNAEYEARAVIIASGARRRHLNIPGEDKFEGKGISYCATCDAPLFKDKITAVVGGGNAGVEAALDLAVYCPKVYLLEYGQALKADEETQEKLKKEPKIEIVLNAKTLRIEGDKFVEALVYQDLKTGEEKKIAVQGIFVEIGSVPNSEIVKNLVKINEQGEIVIDHRLSTTSKTGIFAAGDVTDAAYKQNNISAGDSVKAALSAYNYIKGLG